MASHVMTIPVYIVLAWSVGKCSVKLVHQSACSLQLFENFLRKQASTLTQNVTGPVGPVIPRLGSTGPACKILTGPTIFL